MTFTPIQHAMYSFALLGNISPPTRRPNQGGKPAPQTPRQK